MGKQGDIPRFRNRQHRVDGLLTAPLHLVHPLPIWTTVGPDAPSGLPLPDLGSGHPLVIAIVPFGQRFADLHLFSQPTENTGATGPLQG